MIFALSGEPQSQEGAPSDDNTSPEEMIQMLLDRQGNPGQFFRYRNRIHVSDTSSYDHPADQLGEESNPILVPDWQQGLGEDFDFGYILAGTVNNKSIVFIFMNSSHPALERAQTQEGRDKTEKLITDFLSADNMENPLTRFYVDRVDDRE